MAVHAPSAAVPWVGTIPRGQRNWARHSSFLFRAMWLKRSDPHLVPRISNSLVSYLHHPLTLDAWWWQPSVPLCELRFPVCVFFAFPPQAGFLSQTTPQYYWCFVCGPAKGIPCMSKWLILQHCTTWPASPGVNRTTVMPPRQHTFVVCKSLNQTKRLGLDR